MDAFYTAEYLDAETDMCRKTRREIVLICTECEHKHHTDDACSIQIRDAEMEKEVRKIFAERN